MRSGRKSGAVRVLIGLLLVGGWFIIESDKQYETHALIKEEAEVHATDGRTTVALVTYAIDGDTIEIEGGERVRLLGIDTPEHGECYFAESTEYTRRYVVGKRVRLVSDATDRDKYGRLLRHVFVDEAGEDRHVNALLVAEGYAAVLPIPPDRLYREEFESLETVAKENNLGKWGACGGR